MKKENPKTNREMILLIAKLMNDNMTKPEILKRINKEGYRFKYKPIKESRLSTIIKGILEAGIVESYKPSRIVDKKRLAEVKSMLENGERLVTIAKKYKISKQRAMQLKDVIGINPKDVRQKRKEELAAKINKDIDNGASYCSIKSKYNLKGYDLYELSKKVDNFDCTYTSSRNKRNKEIVKRFKKGTTAKSIAESGLCGIGTVSSIYSVLKNAGVKRYPHISRQGGYNEDPKIMVMIKKYHNMGFSAKQIGDILNNKGFKTIQGVDFSWHNVQYKINLIKNGKSKAKK